MKIYEATEQAYENGYEKGKADALKWIPVTERLPLNDTYVNVTTDGVVVPAYWHNDRFYAFTAERRMIVLKDIDLANKCGSCDHFKQIENTATGECLKNPYNESVVHDPKHPHWIVQRSRIKCPLYNAKPQTNADRIRAMSDEELCEFLGQYSFFEMCDEGCEACAYKGDCDKRLLEWLKQPAEGE